MIRKLTLTNANNETWTFTNRQIRSFLANPQGLGFETELEVIQYGYRANVVKESIAFPNPSGEIVIYDSENAGRYEMYNDFVRFVSYAPLILEYEIPTSPAQTFTLDCYVTSLSKTESTAQNLMLCDVQFQGLGLWKGTEATISDSATTYTIKNEGDVPVGFEITIEGSLENPYFILEQNGEAYGEGKFDDSTAFDSVYVNSKDGEQNIELTQGGSVLANPLSYQDLSISNGSIYVTFVKLMRGESTLTIGMDSGSLSSVNISFIPLYRSV